MITSPSAAHVGQALTQTLLSIERRLDALERWEEKRERWEEELERRVEVLEAREHRVAQFETLFGLNGLEHDPVDDETYPG
ncbi:uncharacterized protein N7515_003880 [Penicillium bovifimosum]|uniref:Uncharacterized protein n=1 Tax=Penicillium bovifimosum TaxID=126998 RepID=A0A9W9L6N0_9EURO|nr:uncharacterized protein N7515_003880 [Penicillium bovifimosum]KAJ5139032.1 hypothetical protein N7515_003880 [Penicillium bovifimosum]